MMYQGTATDGSTTTYAPMMAGYGNMPVGMAITMWVTIVLVWLWLGVGVVAMLKWLMKK